MSPLSTDRSRARAPGPNAKLANTVDVDGRGACRCSESRPILVEASIPGQFRNNSAQRGRWWLGFGQRRPTSTKLGSESTNIGPIFDRCSAYFGPHRPNLSELGQIWHQTTSIGPESPKLGKISTKLDQYLDVARHQPFSCWDRPNFCADIGQVRPSLARSEIWA